MGIQYRQSYEIQISQELLTQTGTDTAMNKWFSLWLSLGSSQRRFPQIQVALVFILFCLFADLALAQQEDQSKVQPLITFLSHRTGHNVLYTMHPDGSQITPVLGGPVSDQPVFTKGVTMFRSPHWTRQSPNGKYFASWVYEEGHPFSKWQGDLRAMLWVGDLQGTWTRILNPDCTELFAWSPDSRQIAWSTNFADSRIRFRQKNQAELSRIYVAGIDGSHSRQVMEKEGSWLVEDWSPDQQRLLITHPSDGAELNDSRCELYELLLSETSPAQDSDSQDKTSQSEKKILKRISFSAENLVISSARYAPDGKSLALVVYNPENMYASNLAADDEWGRMRMMRLLGKIAVLSLDTGEVKVIFDPDYGLRGPICWTADGKEILFSRYLSPNDVREKFQSDKSHGLAIWAINRQGKKPRFITTGWSPDCSRVVNGN